MVQCPVPARPDASARRRDLDWLAGVVNDWQAAELEPLKAEIGRLRADLQRADPVGWGTVPRTDLAGYGARGVLYAGPGASRTSIAGLAAAAAAYGAAALANRPNKGTETESPHGFDIDAPEGFSRRLWPRWMRG